ncbi:MAG: hypothetical protein V3R99_14065, partial [Thermoguttaceae bacterium]
WNEALRALGIAVEVIDENSPTSSRMSEVSRFSVGSLIPRSAQLRVAEVLKIYVKCDHNPLISCEIIDIHGKQILHDDGWGNNPPNEVYLNRCFEKRLPKDVQLRLTVHKDPQMVRVPFVFKGLAIDEKRGQLSRSSDFPTARMSGNRSANTR